MKITSKNVGKMPKRSAPYAGGVPHGEQHSSPAPNARKISKSVVSRKERDDAVKDEWKGEGMVKDVGRGGEIMPATQQKIGHGYKNTEKTFKKENVS